MTERDHEIMALIERISANAKLAQALALHDTSRLLAMAVLDLQTQLHAISPDELRSFTRTVANVVEFRAPANDTQKNESVQNGNVPVLS